MKIKLLLFLSTEKGYKVLYNLIKFDKTLIGSVISFPEIGVLDNYYEKTKNLCLENSITFYDWNGIKNNIDSIIFNNAITDAIAIGWKYLLPLSINQHLNHKLIVFHDSLLPKYRGFCPTPTAIICGEKQIGMSVIFADEHIDKGDIILQKKFEVDKNMYVKEIIEKQSELYVESTFELIKLFLENKELNATKQDENEATYSIWRNEADCLINWNDSAFYIHNLIRAVSFPYTGAFTYLNNQKIYILKASECDDINFCIRQPGKIWNKENNQPLIVCGQGMLRLLDVRYETGQKVIFNKLRICLK